MSMDNPTLEAPNRIEPPGERKRMRFLREAVRKAVLAETEMRARVGYEVLPDSEVDADDWSTAEDYRS